MMEHTNSWMNGWSGGGMWIWTVLSIVLVVVLIIVIMKMLKK